MREENRNWRLEKNRRKNQEPSNRNARIDRHSNGSELFEQPNIDIHGEELPKQPTEHDEEPNNNSAEISSSSPSYYNGNFNEIHCLNQPNIYIRGGARQNQPIEHNEMDLLPTCNGRREAHQ
ncbi:uncharacterized protein LOC116286576 [Actinia tenebrosa]|uniref:Uncharacterized protein LOC116286576 n=1 Tax=Actinia tenebrosa TaxID=6105 RepID=A0A6P8H0V2_ACTTE|nr:uncharacterized protein LOC116286576 [Actinia tenebrosa]